MNIIMQQLINQKINSITESEFIQLAHKHGYQVTPAQTKAIFKIIKAQRIDIRNRAQIDQILERLRTETDPYIAGVVDELFEQFQHYLD
ncbi:hypothetical protein J1TS1_23300 [Shouchella clausii]|uniref:DUF2624 domain-containing protein n=1 Tax=Shouchella clausii TaxID=79880 RepID=UPI001B14F705|nr:DUF2624 domain-containing protein [Shouchella clausii]GIN08185.1 hypothetical protein J1TS1_23300 [Shouchella clausii]